MYYIVKRVFGFLNVLGFYFLIEIVILLVFTISFLGMFVKEMKVGKKILVVFL